jgi:hypothetical protein
MEQITEINNVPEPPVMNYTNYYFGGKSDNNEELKSDVCARAVVTNLKDGHRLCYIKQCGGEFFDPTDISFTYKKKLWKMRKVGEAAFNLYIQFLGHPDGRHQGRKTFKIKAEREN